MSNSSVRWPSSRIRLWIQKKDGDALAARHGRDVVQAGRRIQDEVSGRQLHAVRAVGVLDDQLAAVVVRRDRRRTASPRDRSARGAACPGPADGVVDVTAERVAAGVAIEQRRKDLERQRRRHEERAALQAREDHLAELARLRRVFRQLQVLLGARRLRAGRDAAVDPWRLRRAPGGACATWSVRT